MDPVRENWSEEVISVVATWSTMLLLLQRRRIAGEIQDVGDFPLW